MPASGIQLVALIVRDYDEALSFFVDKLGFELVEDSPATTSMGNRPKRWVTIRPAGSPTSCCILLARADGAEQEAAVGNQFAGRVGFFWHVDDIDATYSKMSKAGIEFLEAIRQEAYGRVTVFRDLYGNKWDLIEDAK